jgi:hypothetical protein
MPKIALALIPGAAARGAIVIFAHWGWHDVTSLLQGYENTCVETFAMNEYFPANAVSRPKQSRVIHSVSSGGAVASTILTRFVLHFGEIDSATAAPPCGPPRFWGLDDPLASFCA